MIPNAPGEWDSRVSACGAVLARIGERIVTEWTEVVTREIATARELPHPILVDTLPAFLQNLAEALSPGFPRSLATETSSIAQEHGGERARLTAYHPQHLIFEYQALKEIILRHLHDQECKPTFDEIRVISSSVDVAIREAVTNFVLVQSSLRDQINATLTHDLRNPLSAIAMAAGLILKRPDGPNSATLAARIVDNTRRIDRMLQDILDATLVSSGARLEFSVSEFDIEELIRETTDEMGTLLGDRFVLRTVPAPVHAGRDVLRRALENLITNAEKYGDLVAKVTITLEVSHERATLSVHNEGAPIPVEEQEAIFQAFLRAQSAKTGKKKGWGLGLALVRGVAESHGGSIVVDSQLGRGTTFVLTIPLDCRPFRDTPVI